MSYLVLARKYRPKNFAELVGQEHVVQALSNALTQQRLHHAYLFTGTRGVGKTTVSRILAKSLNCTGPDGQGGITATPCGVCAACRDIDSGRFPDYTELDAASNRGVDEIQSLLEQAVYKPVQGRFKVFMIDEVHMMTNHAFNAMLKTLEEPPEYLKFVLATTDPQKVPVTVLSRCLQFNLRPMAPDTVLDHLTRVLAAEQVSSEPQALRLLARAARGSMRDALSLTDQAIAFGSGELHEAPVRQMLGAVDRTYVLRLIEALAQNDGRTVVETSDTLRLHGLSAASTLEEMTFVLQRMAVHQAVPDMTPDSADPEAADIRRLATLMPADETQLLYSLCLHGRGELGLAPDEYAALTMTLLRLLAFKPASAEGSAASAEKKTALKAESPAFAPVPSTAPASQAAQGAPNPGAGAVPPAIVPSVSSPASATVPAEALAAAAAPLNTAPARTPAVQPPAVQPTPAEPARSPEAAAPAPAAISPPVSTSAPAGRPVAQRGEPDAATAVEPVARPPASEVPVPSAAPQRQPAPQQPRPAAAASRPAPAAAQPAVADDVPPWEDAEAASWQSMADGWGEGSAPENRELPDRPAPAAPADAAKRNEAARGEAGRVLNIPVCQQPEPGARTAQRVTRTAAADVPPPELVPTPEGDVWFELVESLCASKAVTAMVRQLAIQSQLIARDEGLWHLRVESESLASAALRERLQGVLAEAGHAVKLQVEVGTVKDSPAKRQALAQAERLEAARERIMADPYVQALIRDFDARVVPGSIAPVD